MRTKKTTKKATKTPSKGELQLGRKVDTPDSPRDAVIDTVHNNQIRPYIARFVTDEFTSVCPVTGQPDFATIVVDYVPDSLLVESKALKLYLASFRNYGAFHEECVNMIADKLYEASEPKYMRVVGLFKARGGIAIDVVVERGAKRPDFMLPLPTVR